MYLKNQKYQAMIQRQKKSQLQRTKSVTLSQRNHQLYQLPHPLNPRRKNRKHPHPNQEPLNLKGRRLLPLHQVPQRSPLPGDCLPSLVHQSLCQPGLPPPNQERHRLLPKVRRSWNWRNTRTNWQRNDGRRGRRRRERRR